jgi:hypothetical protein
MVVMSKMVQINGPSEAGRSDAEVIAQLTAAIADLYWVSETDAAFALQQWPDLAVTKLTEKKLLQWLALAPTTPVETVALAAFFELAMTPQDWHGPEEAAIVQRYQVLLDCLQENLVNPQVYRVGNVNLRIYILGKTPAGTWIGLSTEAVET